MPDLRRARCRVNKGGCGRTREEAGPLSWEGLCGDCGPRLHRQAVEDLHYHRGPTFATWRRGMAASVGAILLDDLAEDG